MANIQQWPPKLLEHIFELLSVEEKIRTRLVSKRFDGFIRPLVTVLKLKQNLDQSQLKALSQSYPNLKELNLNPEYNEKCAVLDFRAVTMPQLRILRLRCCRVKTLHFTRVNTPLLEELTVNNAIGAFDGFKLDLPELKDIDIEYATVKSPHGWAPSLSACPKLETFSSHKLWGLGLDNGKSHKLRLPNCRLLGLWRADDIDSLELMAPKLERLDLQGCYSIRRVHLANGLGPNCEVVIVNANIPRATKEHLLAHPRVGKKGLIRKDEVLTMMGEDYGSDADDDDESDDEDFSDDYDDYSGHDLSGVPLPPLNMEQWQAMLHHMCSDHPQNPFGRAQ